MRFPRRYGRGHLLGEQSAITTVTVDTHDLIESNGDRAGLTFRAVVVTPPGVLLTGSGRVPFVDGVGVTGHTHHTQRAELAARARPRRVPLERGDPRTVGATEIPQHVEMVSGGVHEHGVRQFMPPWPGVVLATVVGPARHDVVDPPELASA